MSIDGNLQVRLVTPRGEYFAGPQPRVVAPALTGQITILPLHTALLAYLQPGVVILGEAPAEQRLFVGGGFLEVQHDQVRLLVDAAEPVAAIDRATAQQHLVAAEAALAALDVADPGHARADAEASLARSRADAAA